MVRTSQTALHQLLSRARVWNGDRRADAIDYLERHCTVRDVLDLCHYTGHPEVIRPADDGRLHRSLTVVELTHVVTPAELLTAWSRIRQERQAERRERAARNAQFEEPSIADALVPVFERLSGTELAALYLGHVELLLNLQRQQREGRAGRGIGGKINLANLFRMRMEDALQWLAGHDAAKAQAVSEALRTSPREAALRQADYIDRTTEQGA